MDKLSKLWEEKGLRHNRKLKLNMKILKKRRKIIKNEKYSVF